MQRHNILRYSTYTGTYLTVAQTQDTYRHCRDARHTQIQIIQKYRPYTDRDPSQAWTVN